MKVGYIGLGRMGSGMARNLLKNGADLTVYDTSPEACATLVAEGAKAAASIRDLTTSVDVIFTSLPGPDQVSDVVYCPHGIRDSIRAGQAYFDLSTSSRSLILRIHEDLGAVGAQVFDAPVSGGPAGAASGDLAFWVGGDAEGFENYLPILLMMGDKPKLCGPIGAGTVVKLANNVTGYTIMLTLAETFSTAVKAGVDPLDLWEALRLGVVGKNSPLDLLNAQFLPGRYEPPAFALNLALKDVRLATEMGRELGVPMRLCNLTFAEMTEAIVKGYGDQDSRAYLKLQLERAGVEIAVSQDRIDQAIDRLGR